MAKPNFVVTFNSDNQEEFIKVEQQKNRCPNRDFPAGTGRPCNRVLFVGKFPKDPIEIKCPKCKNLTKFQRL